MPLHSRVLSAHLFDAATLLAQLLFFDALVASWQTVWVRSFFWVYLAFCAAVALKRFDPEYVAGVDLMWRRHPALTAFGVYVAGTVVGAAAVASLVDGVPGGKRLAELGPAVGIPLVLGVTFAAPLIHAWAMHRARRHPRAAPPPAVALALKLLSSGAIFALTLYLLAFVYRMLNESRGVANGHPWMYVLVLFTTAAMLALFYFPGRIHTIFEAPQEPANWWSLWITCGAATLFAVAGVHVGF